MLGGSWEPISAKYIQEKNQQEIRHFLINKLLRNCLNRRVLTTDCSQRQLYEDIDNFCHKNWAQHYPMHTSLLEGFRIRQKEL